MNPSKKSTKTSEGDPRGVQNNPSTEFGSFSKFRKEEDFNNLRGNTKEYQWVYGTI